MPIEVRERDDIQNVNERVGRPRGIPGQIVVSWVNPGCISAQSFTLVK